MGSGVEGLKQFAGDLKWTKVRMILAANPEKSRVLNVALTEILTFELICSPCGRLPDNHSGNLNTEKSGLPAETLPCTRMRTWPF
ncbi:hypothetical protein Y032_0197g1551 [Ancylostoma ceylanicum]|uniref:Uncharacterized protein n=1 Tax=Ancylostoma ceylanicum TaxID=53326 RepID=A0A016SP89_9BILA|nr:hypothetical protein Y032_0197g1551 [Ancylostoma ceylanicum]